MMNFFILLISALLLILCFYRKTFLNPYILVLILTAWTTIGRVAYNFGYYDLQRFFIIAFCLFTALIFIRGKNLIIISYQTIIFGIIVVIFGLASSIMNNHFRIGLIEILHVLIIFMISWLLASVYDKNELLKFIYRLSVISVSVYLVYFMVGYTSHITSLSSPLWPANSTNYDVEKFTGIVFSETLSFSHIRFFNHIQTWTLPVFVSAIVFVRTQRYKIILFLTLSLWWSLLMQSGGRGTFLAVAASLVVVSILFPQNRKRRFCVFLGSLAVGVAAYLALFYSISVPARSITRRGMSGRLQMWEKAWSMFSEHPIFGTGPLSYSIVENKNVYFAHPHNFYLQILSEWGLVVFIIFIIFMILGACKIISITKSKINNQWKELEIGIVWAAGAAFLHAGLSQIFHSPLSQLFIIFFLAWGLKTLYANKKDHPSVQVKTSALAIVSLVVICAFVYLNRAMIGNSLHHYRNYRHQYETHRLYPRIWEQGLFDEHKY